MAVSLVLEEQVLGQDTAEGSAADDDHVERPGVRPIRRLNALESLVEPIAGVSTEDVSREVGALSSRACHDSLLETHGDA